MKPLEEYDWALICINSFRRTVFWWYFLQNSNIHIEYSNWSGKAAWYRQHTQYLLNSTYLYIYCKCWLWQFCLRRCFKRWEFLSNWQIDLRLKNTKAITAYDWKWNLWRKKWRFGIFFPLDFHLQLFDAIFFLRGYVYSLHQIRFFFALLYFVRAWMIYH